MQKNYLLDDFGVTRHETVLQNGLKVIFVEKPYAPIYAKMMIRAGSFHDPVGKEGLAHFTEHIIASGSKEKTKEEFSEIMDSIGAYWNAETSEEYMSVQCEVALNKHLSNIQEYFTHALTEVHFTEDSLQKEKEIITSEIERANSDPDYHAHVYITRKFAQGSAWARPVLGTIETISSFTVEEVKNFFATYCCVENMALVVSGGCTIEDIEKAFNTIPFVHGKKVALPHDPEPIPTTETIVFEQDTPQTSVYISFKGPEVSSREYKLLQFAMMYAHDGITSRFYKKIRNEKGLAYSLYERSISFLHLEYMGTYVGVPTKKAQEAIDAILECYKELIEEGISQKHIDEKIDTMWFSVKRDFQRSSDFVNMLDINALYPEYVHLYGPFPDIFNYRQTFTSEEISVVLKKYITLDNYYLALSGKGVEKFKK